MIWSANTNSTNIRTKILKSAARFMNVRPQNIYDFVEAVTDTSMNFLFAI